MNTTGYHLKYINLIAFTLVSIMTSHSALAADTNPADTNPADTNPADTNPANTNPANSKQPADRAATEKKAEEKKTNPKQAADKANKAKGNAEAAKASAVPKTDANYPLMGEYVGPISLSPNKYNPLALQVRPVGHDVFEAMQFAGGLPGQKSHKPKATHLIGKRSGEFVVLSGGPYAIFVEKDHCLVLNRAGKQIGRLERIVRQSPTIGVAPPKGALVLFDGKNTDQFTTAQMTPDGLLMEGADLKPMFHDFDLHLEFLLPYMPASTGQARGNSGVYLQSRYEVQVLDSFAQDRLINGCGSLYKQRKPDLNMCFPPMQWQTYDIKFTAPRWAADGSKVRNAHITVWLNGVKIHDNVELSGKTGAGKIEEPILLPTRIQNHRDPVRFRNIWLIDRGLAGKVTFPVFPKPGEHKQVLEHNSKQVTENTSKPKPAKSDQQEKKQDVKNKSKPKPPAKPASKQQPEAKPKPKAKQPEKPAKQSKPDADTKPAATQ